MALEEDLHDILRELARRPGVLGVGLGRAGVGTGGDAAAASVRRLPVGGGLELAVLAATGAPAELAADLERAVRALRACLRRWPAAEVADLVVAGPARRTRAALLDRIGRFLEAFAATHGAPCVVLLRGPEVVAVGGTLDEERRERLELLRRRVDAAAAAAAATSHAELADEDVYVRSFWYGAYLVAFFDRPYPLDFVRHRARAVARELAVILPHLDDDPPTRGQVRPT